MNWDQIQGKWNQIKGSARVEWAKLTDQDIEEIRGDRERLVGMIQEKYGETREAAEKAVDDWCARM